MSNLRREGPLHGIRVLAFEQAIALPFATFLMSELGADVIKIERPGLGDVVRGWDDAVRGLSSGFVAFNAGKRDVAIDASSSRGQEAIRAIASTCDVFVENFAPGVVDRLGLGYEDLSKADDGLIYCSLSGYGQDGPYRDVKAYDLLIQGESGILLNNGSAGAPAKVGMPITDQMAGSQVVNLVLAALLERTATGKGSYIDLSLLETAFLWLGYYPQIAWMGKEQPPPRGMRHQFISPYGPFMASDGVWVNLVVASQHHWLMFCEKVVDRPDWKADERFATMSARRVNRDALDVEVEQTIATRASAHWFEMLEAAGLPFGRVRQMSEVVDHPQLLARGAIAEGESPVGDLKLVKMRGSLKAARRVPALGEHTREVLAEAGYDDSEIEVLDRLGVI